MDNNKTGQFIAGCRKKKGYTQQELADVLGVTNKAISKWETGHGMPDISLLPALSEALGVSIDAIVKGEESLQPPEKHEAGNQKSADDNPVRFIAEARDTAGNLKEYYRGVYHSQYKWLRYGVFIGAIIATFSAFFTYMLHHATGRLSMGLAFFLLTLGVCLLLLGCWGYRLRAHFRRRDLHRQNREDEIITCTFYDDRCVFERQNASGAFAYDKVRSILETKGLYTLVLHKESYMLNKSGFQKGSLEEFRGFIADKCKKIKEYTPAGQLSPFRKVTGCLLLIAALPLLVIQLGYLTFGRYYLFEYLWDELPYILNFVLIFFVFGAALFFFRGRKRRNALVSLLAVLLCGANLLVMLGAPKDISVVELSPDWRQTLVLKQDPETGKMVICRNRVLCFAQAAEQLPYTVLPGVKTQWLTGDVCTVTYESPDDGNIHQYVAAYGDRGDGGSYYYVTTALEGQWYLKDVDNTVGWYFKMNHQGFVVGNASAVWAYTYEDCVQVGTLAVVLCKDGLPQWTIALGEDCKVEDVTNTLQVGNTIVLCRVSMEQTAPLRFAKAGAADSREWNEDLPEFDANRWNQEGR